MKRRQIYWHCKRIKLIDKQFQYLYSGSHDIIKKLQYNINTTDNRWITYKPIVWLSDKFKPIFRSHYFWVAVGLLASLALCKVLFMAYKYYFFFCLPVWKKYSWHVTVLKEFSIASNFTITSIIDNPPYTHQATCKMFVQFLHWFT